MQPIDSKENAVPFLTIAVDFVTKLPLSQGFDTILTVTDQGCTKAVILVPCKETDGTKEIADPFKDHVFPYSRILQKIISDRDTRFTLEYHKLCATLGIEQNLSTAYHPQTDRQSERTNQTMEDLLRIYCNHQQNDWSEWLTLVQYIINSRPSSTTKETPYDLWMGFTPLTHQAMVPVKVSNLIKRRTELTKARKNALQVIQNAQEKWGKSTTYIPYSKGDLVWLEGTNLHTTHPTKKLRQKRFGPFKVIQEVGAVSFKLELPSQRKIHPIFHAKLLHPYKETEKHGANFQESPSDLVDGEPEWEIEFILDSWWH